MAAHPGLGPAETPDGDAFSCAEQSGEDHERKTERAEEEADGAATAEMFVEGVTREEIDDGAGRENCDCSGGPCALGLVDAH